MLYSDLHCDTLYRIVTENLSFDSELLAVSPRKASCFDKYSQLMAVWIPDSIRGRDAYALFEKCVKAYQSNFLPLCNENVKYMLAVENGSVIGGDLSKIRVLSDLQVRAVTIVYNEDNELGSGAFSDSCFGLTKTGKESVAEFEKQGIFIDLSHSSLRTFYDVAELSSKPVIATHSNSYSLCPHMRNLTDEQFLLIKKSGGIVGVNFYPPFLNSNPAEACLDDVIKHIEHFLSLGGEDTVCIGSDFDGCDPLGELNGLDKVSVLYENMLKLNYNEQLVQKILYYNAHNFFT